MGWESATSHGLWQGPPCQHQAGVVPSISPALARARLALRALQGPRPAVCVRLSDHSGSAGLGGLQPAQRGLIKSEIPAVFSPGLWLGMPRVGKQWKEIMRIRATSRAVAFPASGGLEARRDRAVLLLWDGREDSRGKAVPSLQLSILRVWGLFKPRAGSAISKPSLMSERLRAWQQASPAVGVFFFFSPLFLFALEACSLRLRRA